MTPVHGGLFLATTCSKVYSRGGDNRVLVIDAGAEGGAFIEHKAMATPFAVYSVTSDARFLYYGAANGQGLRRVDTTDKNAGVTEFALGSAWGIAATDDAVIWGEHGGLGSFSDQTVGSIFSIAK